MIKKQLILGIVLGVLLLTVSVVSGQTGNYDRPVLIDSVGPTADGDLKGRFDLLLAEVTNNLDSRAILYIHGTPAQIAARTRWYRNQLTFRRFDTKKISFVSGRNFGNVRTDMWLVPKGAAEPDIKPEAWIFKEVGRATKATLVQAVNAVINESFKFDRHQTYIINYGTSAQVGERERWIRNAIASRHLDSSRITLVNGGPGPVRTVLWLVPPGTEFPKP